MAAGRCGDLMQALRVFRALLDSFHQSAITVARRQQHEAEGKQVGIAPERCGAGRHREWTRGRNGKAELGVRRNER